MKKKGLIAFVITMLVCGCSCNNVNENTYINAVDNFNNSDALSFTRIEKIVDNNDSSSYRKTTVNASFVFDTNRRGSIEKMQYFIDTSVLEQVTSSVKYYYIDSSQTLYRHKHVTGDNDTKYKQELDFSEFFNVHSCQDTACFIAIPSNIAPIFDIEDVVNFSIEEVSGEAVVKYTAACPTYEICNGKETLDYKLTIGGNGDIVGLTYTISGETETTIVSYSFNGYNSQNVEIAFPNDLASYTERIID